MSREKNFTLKFILAFAVIYIIWGTTYLGIRYAIETIPPFFVSGGRGLFSGLLLYLWLRLSGHARPTRSNWLAAALVGGFLVAGGNGAVSWSEQRVPTGLAALLISTVPLWMVFLNWLRPDGSRPSLRVFIGLFLGFLGMVLLVSPARLLGAGQTDLLGAAVLLAGAFCWAFGSIFAKVLDLPKSMLMATAMEILVGGALSFLLGLASGEGAHFHLATLTARSVIAFTYLAVFGSLLGFTCYNWLLQVATTPIVSTYAYVNPIVAILIGWLVLGEAMTLRTGLAGLVIIAAVVLITTESVSNTSQESPLVEAP